LYPSEKAVYDLTDKTLEVINVDVESEIAWKEGRLVFKEYESLPGTYLAKVKIRLGR
jgi:ferric-dicitrate binding protein FerR (iron transport regulator)